MASPARELFEEVTKETVHEDFLAVAFFALLLNLK